MADKPDIFREFIKAADGYLYLSKLEDALRSVPPTPPIELTERDFQKIKRRARSILKKLRVFEVFNAG